MASIFTIIASLLPQAKAEGPVLSPIQDVKNPAGPIDKAVPLPDLKERVLSFYKSKMPKLEKTSLEDYYPVVKDLDEILAKEKLRPGAGSLGALQAFFESTGGRTTPNIYGVKPGGKSKKFNSVKEATDYQYGKNVLGGGSGGRLNILNKKEGLSESDISSFYSNYDPEGAYLGDLLSGFRQIYGIPEKAGEQK